MSNYLVALAEVRNRFGAKDPGRLAELSDALWLGPAGENQTTIKLRMLHEWYQVFHPSGDVSYVTKTGEVPLADRILILHYLTTATGAPARNEWISFRQVPGGDVYLQPFAARTVAPFVRCFGARPEALLPAAKELGGAEVPMGHCGVVLPVFPRLPMAFILWRGSEEFDPAGNILFDASAPAYLETEALVVAAGRATRALAEAHSRLGCAGAAEVRR